MRSSRLALAFMLLAFTHAKWNEDQWEEAESPKDPSCSAGWCKSPEGPSQQCQMDVGPPWADDAESYPNVHYHAAAPAAPILQAPGKCPSPLKAACASKGVKTAHLDGPVNCGGKGFFCRIIPQEGWRNPFPKVMEQDKMRGFREANFYHCNTTKKPAQALIDSHRDHGWTSAASGLAGHCHGSDADDAYGWFVRDHWFRGYAGTLHCCCDYGAAKGVVNRCDFRRHVATSEIAAGTCVDSNEDHKGNTQGRPSTYEGGCKADDVKTFADPLYTEPDKCWSVSSFADPSTVTNAPISGRGGGTTRPNGHGETDKTESEDNHEEESDQE